jgi:hypothetical protein
MADKKIGLKDTLKLAPKVVLKKNEPNLEATERIVDKIHAESTLPPPLPQPIAVVVEPEPTETVEIRRITLDVPLDLYKQMKMKVFEDAVTLKKYILELVRQDLDKTKKG